MNIKPLFTAISLALCVHAQAQPIAPLQPGLPITPELSRIQQLGTRALQPNAPPLMRRQVLADMFRVALEAELLFAVGRRGDAALRYAVVARASDDPEASQRASEMAAAAENLALANEFAQRWAQLDESNARAKEVSSALALAQGDVNRALDALIARLPSNKAERDQALPDLARALVRNQDRTQAVSLMRALAAREKSAPAYYGLAIAEFAASLPSPNPRERAARSGTQDVSGVLAATAQALAIDENYAPAAAMRIDLLARENASEARASAQAFLQRNPGATEVRMALGQLLADGNQPVLARTEFLRAAKEAQGRVKTEATYAAAVLALRLKQPEQALAELSSLENDENANANIVKLQRGQALDALKRYPEAIVQWSGIAQDSPGWREAQWRIAGTLARGGDAKAGRTWLDDKFANDDDPEMPASIVQTHAGWFREKQQYTQALDVLNAGLEAMPNKSELLYDAAMLHDRLKQFDLMEARLRQLIAQQPDNAQAHNALAYSFAERNVKIEEARRLIDRAVTLAPEDAAIMDSVGWVYFREGKFAESEQWLRRALEKMNDGEVVAHLAEVLIAANRRDEARKLIDSFPVDGSNAELVKTARERFFAR